MSDLKDYIKRQTLEQQQGINTGIWLAKWLQLYGSVFREAARLYVKNFASMAFAGALAAGGVILSLGILSGPLITGFYLLAFGVVRPNGPMSTAAAFKLGFRDPLTTILMGIAVLGIMAGGFFLFAGIPLIGILIGYIFVLIAHSFLFLIFPVLADRQLKLVPGFVQGLRLACSHWLPFAFFSLVALVLGCSGVVLKIIGIVLTLPLYCLAITIFYSRIVEELPVTIAENLSLRRN
ncbi:MAG TPA: hypothetical protein PLP17_08720 [Oligoflexia bacterium]|nr:hypothetical protein [Oligoflexia bacterium]